MKTPINSVGTLFWLVASTALVLTIVVLFSRSGTILGQSDTPSVAGDPGVFTPAHSSFGEAVYHFLGIQDEPTQPMAFSHNQHVENVGLPCVFCHDGVGVGPRAGIAGVETCMLCHSEVGRDLPGIQALTEYREAGLEPPWAPVYGWLPEAHVRFNHRPHEIAGVACETCHGDVSAMGIAERAVEHSMDFCVDCHEQEQASNECIACHY
jgi:hypothetical protein